MTARKSIEKRFNELILYVKNNERKLGALLFFLGFLTDLLTFGLLEAETVNWFFITYLVLAAVTILGSHHTATYVTRDSWWKKTLAVLFPLGAQYAFGGLFSGFVVFYARSSVFSVSWPFLLLLALVYIGNEYYRKQREHTLFQTVLFFIALYAYAIFALPLYLHTIGPWIFLLSTLTAVVVFGLFSLLLFYVHKERLLHAKKHILSAVSGIVLVVVASYFSGLIPPLPLAVSEAGAYHAVERVPGGYAVTTEEAGPWWHIGDQTLTISPGGQVTVLTAIKAPIAFSNTVVHHWEWYNKKENKWISGGKISFPMSGGRKEGYRGYSTKSALQEGKWRVSIETPNGQTIGRLSFVIAIADTMPKTITELR